MGRIRTKDIKNISRELAQNDKLLPDFEENKQYVNSLKITGTKRMRNKLAGYLTRCIIVKKKRANFEI